MFYILKLSVSICLVFLFYRLLLRRLTFYTWNRCYLVGYSLVAFFIPLINISSLVESSYVEATPVIRYIPVIENYSGKAAQLTHTAGFHGMTTGGVVMMLIAAGSLLMIVRLIFQYRSLQKIKRKAIILSRGEAVIYHIDQPVLPFSFGDGIYVNKDQHSEKELEEIILHEYVHVRQKHTIDILLAELLCVVNWYNPFAWLIRHAIRQNLEFIADNEVLNRGLDKKAYQYHLLKVVGTPQYQLAVNFNLSSLKKRIVMMNSLKSARLHLLRFLFIMPMIAVLLVAFRNKVLSTFKSPEKFINEAGMVVNICTRKPFPGVLVKEVNTGLSAMTDENGFYHLALPVTSDTFKCHFLLDKKGSRGADCGFSVVGAFRGFVHILGLPGRECPENKLTMFVGEHESFPGIPSYNDVLKVFAKALHRDLLMQDYLRFEKDHPQVGMFYTAENKIQHIVFLKNGDVEKYGYENGPSIKDMEYKYGPLPEVMKEGQVKNQDYLERWKQFSSIAEKKFNCINPSVRTIIFPGDSRVIVVSKTGEHKLYDMDNAAPEERPEFEKLYGSLEGIVPPPSNFVNMFPNNMLYKDWQLKGIRFIGFSDAGLEKEHSIFHLKGNGTIQIGEPSTAEGLIIYKGREYDAESFGREFGKSNLHFAEVTSYEHQGAFDHFGQKGQHGVVVIGDEVIKSPTGRNADQDTLPLKISGKDADTGVSFHEKSVRSIDQSPPILYVIDGIKIPEGVNLDKLVDLNDISSINVLKDSSATARYGERAKSGVVQIQTKTGNYRIPFLVDASTWLNAAVFVVDGKQVSDLKTIHPEDIKSMSILKDSVSLKKYGAPAKKGVLFITTVKSVSRTDSLKL